MTARVLAAVVGVVVALAGAMKLVDRRRWLEDAARQRLWPWVAQVVPVVELALGAALIVLSPSPAVLGATTLLILVFTAFLLAQVAAGSQVPCACFGARSSRPPSMRDVARNIGLMALLFASAALS